MQPTFFPGDTVVVSSIGFIFRKPTINDIIAFKDKDTGKFFIKRIKKIQNESYFVEGDNKTDSKQVKWINKNQIVGKVIWKISL